MPPAGGELFGKAGGAAAASLGRFGPSSALAQRADSIRFTGPDSLVVGKDWASLNPGYWQIKGGALRRRFGNYGERARSTGFPFHYETHKRNGGVMNTDYDPSLPPGDIYRRDQKYSEGKYTIAATFTYRGAAEARRKGDSDDWKMYQPGYGLMGVAIGAKSVHESYGKIRNATVIGWTDDGKFGFVMQPKGSKNQGKKQKTVADAPALKSGDTVWIQVDVKLVDERNAQVRASFGGPGGERAAVQRTVARRFVDGYVGIAARGLADFELNELNVLSFQSIEDEKGFPAHDCLVCYPLGDTLKQVDGKWRVRFVGMFGSDGKTAELRVADSPNPKGGWAKVKPAGRARIVNNKWRRNTATIHVTLPANPADKELYYTVWKDGRNVTSDPRIGAKACGPGTGYVGDVPASGDYVGRLPRLKAPYKICGLSCHALTSGLQQRTKDGFKILGGGDDWQFRDQPTVEAYKRLEDYGFQVMCWEDDVWDMELML